MTSVLAENIWDAHKNAARLYTKRSWSTHAPMHSELNFVYYMHNRQAMYATNLRHDLNRVERNKVDGEAQHVNLHTAAATARKQQTWQQKIHLRCSSHTNEA